MYVYIHIIICIYHIYIYIHMILMYKLAWNLWILQTCRWLPGGIWAAQRMACPAECESATWRCHWRFLQWKELGSLGQN